jgi:uncharacterized protein
MELSESKTQGQVISEVHPDALVIGGKRYEQSLYIIDDTVFLWDIQQVEHLKLQQLEPLMMEMPQLILIGVEPFNIEKHRYFMHSDIQPSLLQQGIGCEITSISAACNTWNIVLGEQRKVCLALIRE